jgi:tripartite-type tricarboxylate transporter receptor subunit TctC
MSGESQLTMSTINSTLPFVRSGRLRALGVSSRERAPLIPDVPTIHESGVPGYIKTAWFGLFAPAGVPQPIVDRVHQAFVQALKDPEIERRLRADAMVAGGESPSEFSAFVRSELDEWAKLIREMKL